MTPTVTQPSFCPAPTLAAAPKLPLDSVLARLGADARQELDRILLERSEHILHKSFANPRTAEQLFGKAAGQVDSIKPWCNSADVRPPNDCAGSRTKTLATEQEQKLFLRLNYARWRIARLLEKYAGKRLTGAAAREILWWHARAGEARCRIVQANVPLVLAMAKRTRLGSMDFAELISEGNMALLRSVDKFDCGRGFKFSTYACRAILKSFSRVAMRTGRYRGRFPTEFDPTLEKSHYAEEQRELHEAECVDELRGIIRSNSALLNDVEVKVLQARFALGPVQGLDGDGPKTLEQVGLLIGVTKERVRQIQNKALAKLRSKLQEDFLAA
jgi:RNA polymerase sigma factor (sigma-70 family)